MCVTECYQDGVCVCAHVCVCVGLRVCFCARLQSNSIASYLQGKMTWMHPSPGCEPFPPSLPACLSNKGAADFPMRVFHPPPPPPFPVQMHFY